MPLSVSSASDHLPFEQTLARLKTSPNVEGVAAFGSRATDQPVPTSDHDLLILVHALPARVFQMVTSIAGRLADIVLVEVSTADALLLAGEPPEPRSFEGLFARKMRTARILYDPSGLLHRVQQLVTGAAWEAKDTGGPPATDLYATWFWQSFGLLHLERLMQSREAVSLTAFDMMLSSCLPGTWRAYFDLRGIPWEGEKAALRYWSGHDTGYLRAVRGCLEHDDRGARFEEYRELVAQTLAPVGLVFGQGETAVVLFDSDDPATDVPRTLRYWNELLAGETSTEIG